MTLSQLLKLAGIRLILTEMSADQAKSVFLYYGVQPSLDDLDDLKKQFRGLAIKNHPDKGGSKENMQEIISAYDILKKEALQATTEPEEQIRRKPDQAFEDFTDAAYFARRVKSISSGNTRNCIAYAFDGTTFTSEIPLEASLTDKVVLMVREGMLTQGGSYTKIVGLVFNDEPKKFYVVYNAKNRGNQHVSYVPMGSGFNMPPKRDIKLIAQLQSLLI